MCISNHLMEWHKIILNHWVQKFRLNVIACFKNCEQLLQVLSNFIPDTHSRYLLNSMTVYQTFKNGHSHWSMLHARSWSLSHYLRVMGCFICQTMLYHVGVLRLFCGKSNYGWDYMRHVVWLHNCVCIATVAVVACNITEFFSSN